MTIVQFNDWRPDYAPLDAGALNMLNTIRVQDGYEVIPSPQSVGYLTQTGVPLALIVGRTSSGITTPLLLTDSASYRGNLGKWVLLENSSMVSESWATLQFGDKVYAVNGRAPLQSIVVEENSRFQTVPDLPNGLSARYICSVSQFVMLADIREFDGSTRYPFRLQWSGLQRPERYEVQPNAIQSDYQDVADIGEIRGITGGEFLLVLGAIGLTRGDYVGGDLIFKFSTLETDIGCDIPQSVYQNGDVTWWHSSRGFRASNGGVSVGIGIGHVDQWFSRVVDTGKTKRMTVTVLDSQPIVKWAFCSVFAPDEEPDYILAYNWERKSWTNGQYRVSIFGKSVVPQAFTDDEVLPLPNYNPTKTTDDPEYTSFITDTPYDNATFLAAMVDGNLCRLVQSGDVEAQIETKELMLGNGSMARLSKFLPLVHSATTIRAKVRSRDIQSSETYRVRDNLKPEPSGRFSCSVKGRYQTITLYLNGPFKRAIGVDVMDVFPGGGR